MYMFPPSLSVLYYTRNNKQCKNTYFSLINTNLIIAFVAGKLYESTQSYMSALIMLLVLIPVSYTHLTLPTTERV